MGKSFNGPYGHLNGKVGKLVHYMLKGQPIVRVVGAPSKKRSHKQKANQQAMSVIMNLLRPASRFINAGFELMARDTVWNPHNLAVSYNKRQALKGEYPKLSVDYSKVQLSQGDLPLAKKLEMKREENGIRISWDPAMQDQGDYDDDMVMVMTLYPEKDKANCILNATQRGTGSCFIPLEHPEGTQIEVYLAFKSSDGSGVSDTAYLGNLNGVAESKEERRKKEKRKAIENRLKIISANYFKQIQDNKGVKPQSNRFRALEKEYQDLKQRLDNLPLPQE